MYRAAFATFIPATLIRLQIRKRQANVFPLTSPVFIVAKASNTLPPWQEDDPLLKRLDSIPDPPEIEEITLEGRTNLNALLRYTKNDLTSAIEKFLSKPTRLLSLSALAILFGIFSATSASTIIGSVADWDPLAAAVLLIWTESFTKYYYRLERKARLLQLINAFKIGLIYGMTIDAFKLST